MSTYYPFNEETPLSPVQATKNTMKLTQMMESDMDPDDPNLTLPLVRYNAMLAVLRNTLYM